jgi:hypothetical protein
MGASRFIVFLGLCDKPSAIQTVDLADMLDQDPTAGNTLRPDLDLVLDLDVDLDLDISVLATLSSPLWQWIGETSELSWRRDGPRRRPGPRSSPRATVGISQPLIARLEEPWTGVSSSTLFGVATV